MQIQDHTGLTWVTAFQESGEEIMGISAKNLYYLKYEEQDDEKFSELMRGVLFTKFLFKLKVKEETFSDEQRVKSTIVKAEKLNYQMETRYLLDLIAKFQEEDSSCLPPKIENVIPTPGLNTGAFGGRQSSTPATNDSGIATTGTYNHLPASQTNSYGNQYGGSRFTSPGTGSMYMSCSSCGGTGHNATNCPSVMTGPGQSYGSNPSKVTQGASTGASASGECFKCHQFGHWARDCPGTAQGNVPPAYGSTPGRYGLSPKQHVRGF